MTQVCIPSIHKATNPARWLRAEDKKKPRPKYHDDFKKRDVVHLHSISRVGSAPMTANMVKDAIEEHHRITGKILTTIITPETFAGSNRGIGVMTKKFGYVYVMFKRGKAWGAV